MEKQQCPVTAVSIYRCTQWSGLVEKHCEKREQIKMLSFTKLKYIQSKSPTQAELQVGAAKRLKASAVLS